MKGILVVSFGTSYDETREKNITVIEKDMEQYGIPVYHAFTSKRICEKLAKRGVIIPSVEQAMDQMREDGITEVFVLPTFLLHGLEYEKLTEIVRADSGFASVKVAVPLLATVKEQEKVLACIHKAPDRMEEEALVLVGHGSGNEDETWYQKLGLLAKEKNFSDLFVGAIMGKSTISQVVEEVKNAGYQKVLLTPLMLVAGHHAYKDVESDDEWSCKSQFQKAGLEVRIQSKGLGEYAEIRKIYGTHIEDIMSVILEKEVEESF